MSLPPVRHVDILAHRYTIVVHKRVNDRGTWSKCGIDGFFASDVIANDEKLTNLKEGLLLKSW